MPKYPTSAETTSDLLPSAIQTYFSALNADDPTGLEQIWSPNATLTAVGTRPRQGRAEVMEYYTHLFEPWTKHMDIPDRVIIGENCAVTVVEVSFVGTSQSGKEIRFPAIDVFDMQDDLISGLSIWYDLLWVRKQLA